MATDTRRASAMKVAALMHSPLFVLACIFPVVTICFAGSEVNTYPGSGYFVLQVRHGCVLPPPGGPMRSAVVTLFVLFLAGLTACGGSEGESVEGGELPVE